MKKITKIFIVIYVFFLQSGDINGQKASTGKYNVYSKPVVITGGYQVKRYVSYNQVQEKDYKGTGSWQKIPCNNCPVIIIKKDSIRNAEKAFQVERRGKPKKDTALVKLGAFIVYTNAKGTFECGLRDFSVGQGVHILYGSVANKRSLKLSQQTNAGVYTQN
jgi:hypothetical protein